MQSKFAQAIVNISCWKLPKNEIWNIPEKSIKEVQFLVEHLSSDNDLTNFVIGKIISVTALVIDVTGKIYGIQKATEIEEDEICCYGQVSLNDTKIKCHAGSKFFEREDGSLCKVAVLWFFP